MAGGNVIRNKILVTPPAPGSCCKDSCKYYLELKEANEILKKRLKRFYDICDKYGGDIEDLEELVDEVLWDAQ